MVAAFVLDAMLVNAAFQSVIKRRTGLTPRVIVWGAISYHGRSNLLRIEGNLISNRYVHEVLQSEVVPFLQGIPGAIFQQDNACLHVAKTVGDFCSAHHMKLLLWPAYSPDMLLIGHMWDVVGQRLALDPLPAASKDELLLAYQQYGILFHKQIFKICLTPCHAV
ncbi:transposable element Tc1 transposase [Trichonephila clavipes]|nr:transposable element Tc1 transposase [Trichonephila clavipes]